MKSYSVLHPFTMMPAHDTLSEESFAARYVLAETGEGAWVTDRQGNHYYNISNATTSLGSGHPAILKAIMEQYKKLSVTTLFAQGHWVANQLAERLLHLLPQYKMVFYSNDGAGSIESAMKLARQYFLFNSQPQRKKFISLDGGYHGTSYGALSLTKMGFDGLYGPMVEGCISVPAPNLYRPLVEGTPAEQAQAAAALLEQAILAEGPETIAAMVIEPIQGVNGIIMFPDEYFPLVRAITRKYGILLIVDEVCTGMGRLGHWFASSHWEIDADLMTLSKGLTAGYFPLGVTLLAPGMCPTFLGEYGGFPHGTTSSGHPVACATALAVIDLIESQGLVENARKSGEYMLSEMHKALDAHPHVGEIRGLGLMLGIEFVDDKMAKTRTTAEFDKKLQLQLRKEGILASYFEGKLCLYPPINVNQSDADLLIQSIINAVEAVAKIEEVL